MDCGYIFHLSADRNQPDTVPFIHEQLRVSMRRWFRKDQEQDYEHGKE